MSVHGGRSPAPPSSVWGALAGVSGADRDIQCAEEEGQGDWLHACEGRASAWRGLRNACLRTELS